MALVGWGGGAEGEVCILRSPRIAASPISLFCLWEESSLWAELNGGENSLHWKANMLPLFSISYDSVVETVMA